MMIRVGVSGWRYAPWRSIFYPRDLPQRLELQFLSRLFSTVEINGSFYSLQRPESYRRWYDETPAGFVFAVKGSRFITHMKKLNDVKIPLANFFASGILGLSEKLGPLLWQFPPQMVFDESRFEAFFTLLPKSAGEAARLGRNHDKRLKGRALLRVRTDAPLRHAVEVRHESFRNRRFLALLTRFNVALTVADTAGKWPLIEEQTADFGYVRLHGDKELYASGYGDQALSLWSKKIKRLSRGGRDIYVYFDNDVKVRAPFDARSLTRKLGAEPPDLTRTWDLAMPT